MDASESSRAEDPVASAELERLQAERDALAEELDRLKAPRKRRFRGGVVAILVAVSCTLAVLSTTVVWAHRTVLNTDTFVGTIGPVFQHPEVDAAVASRATNELFTELHLQTRLREALPPRVGFAAGPIVNATQGYVSGQLTKVLASERFEGIWIQTLTSTHESLVALLRGQKTSTLSTANGYIVLNTVPVVNKALGSVSGLASNLTGRNVTLPTITSVEVPKQAVDKLSHALGVQLPSNFGQITLVRSNNLAVAQRGVRAFDRLSLALPLVTIALIAVTLWLSESRRRTLIQLLVATSLLLIVLRRIVLYEQGALAKAAHNPQVASIILTDLLHGFFILTAAILAVSLVVLVVALLTGPYPWAVALRRFVVSGWRRGVEGLSAERRDRASAWAKAHPDGLQIVGAAVAGVVLLIVSISWWSFLVIGGLLVIFEVALQSVKSGSPPEEPLASGPEDETDLASPIGRP